MTALILLASPNSDAAALSTVGNSKAIIFEDTVGVPEHASRSGGAGGGGTAMASAPSAAGASALLPPKDLGAPSAAVPVTSGAAGGSAEGGTAGGAAVAAMTILGSSHGPTPPSSQPSTAAGTAMVTKPPLIQAFATSTCQGGHAHGRHRPAAPVATPLLNDAAGLGAMAAPVTTAMMATALAERTMISAASSPFRLGMQGSPALPSSGESPVLSAHGDSPSLRTPTLTVELPGGLDQYPCCCSARLQSAAPGARTPASGAGSPSPSPVLTGSAMARAPPVPQRDLAANGDTLQALREEVHAQTTCIASMFEMLRSMDQALRANTQALLALQGKLSSAEVNTAHNYDHLHAKLQTLISRSDTSSVVMDTMCVRAANGALAMDAICGKLGLQLGGSVAAMDVQLSPVAATAGARPVAAWTGQIGHETKFGPIGASKGMQC